MMITVEARSRCALCGCYLSSLAFPSVRVNRRSLRQMPGTYLRCSPPRCPECGTGPNLSSPVLAPLVSESYVASHWRLTAQSWREITEYRERRWPS